MRYGALLFATGASPRRLVVPGADQKDVYVLRTFEDAVAIAAALKAQRVAVVGGGFIGLEVAATAAQAGCCVTVIEAAPRLLSRAVPEIVSEAVLRKFESEGVTVVLRQGVREIREGSSFQVLELIDGACIEADAIVIGIGATPNDELARKAGLQVGGGIVVDADGRTSDPHCFAAGDVASRPAGLHWYPQHRCRFEAWEPALQQARAVAQVMRGRPVMPIDPPWVWSDMFDWNIQMLGHGEIADSYLVRPGGDEKSFSVFQLRAGRLVGAVTVNDGRHMAPLKREIVKGPYPDPAKLTDPAVPLRTALRESPTSQDA